MGILPMDSERKCAVLGAIRRGDRPVAATKTRPPEAGESSFQYLALDRGSGYSVLSMAGPAEDEESWWS